jgi:hypothetical protein
MGFVDCGVDHYFGLKDLQLQRILLRFARVLCAQCRVSQCLERTSEL